MTVIHDNLSPTRAFFPRYPYLGGHSIQLTVTPRYNPVYLFITFTVSNPQPPPYLAILTLELLSLASHP